MIFKKYEDLFGWFIINCNFCSYMMHGGLASTWVFEILLRVRSFIMHRIICHKLNGLKLSIICAEHWD